MKDRPARLVLARRDDHPSEWAAISAIGYATLAAHEQQYDWATPAPIAPQSTK